MRRRAARQKQDLTFGLSGKTETTCAPVVMASKQIRVCVTKPEKPGPQMTNANDVCHFLRNAKRSDRESLYALHLDAQNQIIGAEEVARGTTTSVETSPREIFKSAFLTNAAAIIIAHNHPSDNPTPSHDDVDFTNKLGRLGKSLGVPLRDHVIVAERGCTSMREQGMSTEFAGGRLRKRPKRRR